MIGYNEFEPYAANWLCNLVREDLLPKGLVDRRDMKDMSPEYLSRFTQYHFFAGIGGWPLALRMAGVPEHWNIWTGSCPCQPFSIAGKRKGKDDERHLWPVWFNLIKQCRPELLFGEQVEAAITQGWMDDVKNDLEAEGYAVGFSVLPACSVGAPHQRQRLWFVAYSLGTSPTGRLRCASSGSESIYGWRSKTPKRESPASNAGDSGVCGSDVADSDAAGPQRWELLSERTSEQFTWEGGMVACPDGKSRPVEPGVRLLADGVPARVGRLRAYGNAIVPQVAAEFVRASIEAINDSHRKDQP